MKTDDQDGAAANDQPVAAPLLTFSRPIAGNEGRWERQGDYILWAGYRDAGESGYVLHEWIEKGILVIPSRREPSLLHRIPAGRPYHVSHLFGFWIVNDCDTIWLEAYREEVTYYTLMLGGMSEKPADSSCLWVCPKCATCFGAESTDARSGYEKFLEFALKRVRAFNADPALRGCPRCQALHPLSYGFHREADTAEERIAREAV